MQRMTNNLHREEVMDAHSFSKILGTDRFQLIRLLGSGAHGAVYEVFDRERCEQVALKLLLRASASRLHRFKREFRALQGMMHPNLVSFYELFSYGEQWFFTMKLVRGTDFLTSIRGFDKQALNRVLGAKNVDLDQNLPEGNNISNRTYIDFTRLRIVLRGLVEGLCMLHESGKLHRDIKPSNIMVTTEDCPILLDFGLVADISPNAVSQSDMVDLVGTPSYMSPEQLAGRSLDSSTDWYSVGVVLYELLTGQIPHVDVTNLRLWDLMRKRQELEPPPPAELMPNTPRDLDAMCTRLLRRNPADRPFGREILSWLGTYPQPYSLSSGVPNVVTRTPVFVGRTDELTFLRRAVLGVSQGQSMIVHVRGESGYGKTALVEHFMVEELSLNRYMILRGRCYERESIPHKALDSLIDDLYRSLASFANLSQLLPSDVWALRRLFPVLGRIGAIAAMNRTEPQDIEPREVRRYALNALGDLLRNISKHAQVVIHIDDIQWGDADSGNLLAELFFGKNPLNLLLILTYKKEDQNSSAFLKSFHREDTEHLAVCVKYLDVGPLTDGDVKELFHRLTDGTCDEKTVVQITAESGGSPLFVGELVHEMAQPSLKHSGNSNDIISLQRVIARRIGQLPAASQRLLEVIAVAGHPIVHSIVMRAAVPSDDGRGSLEQLHAFRLIRTSAIRPDAIEVYHDRIREVVLHSISEENMKMYHYELAIALKCSDHGDSHVLAYHFWAAGRSQIAGEYFLEAADTSEVSLAFDNAAALYRRALECMPSYKENRKTLIRLATALENAGRYLDASVVYLKAATNATPKEGLRLQLKAARQILASGCVDDGFALIRTVLAGLDIRMPETRLGTKAHVVMLMARIRLRGLDFHWREDPDTEAILRIDTCWILALCTSHLDPIRGTYFQSLNLHLSLKTGDPYRVARALSVEGVYGAVLRLRTLDESFQLFEQAEKIARQLNEPYLVGLVALQRGITAFLVEDRWIKAWELCQRSMAILLAQQRSGVSYELHLARFYSLHSLLMRGRLRELSQEIPRALDAAIDHSDLFAECVVRLRLSPLICLASNQPERVSAERQHLAARLSPHNFYLQHYWNIHSEIQEFLYRDKCLLAWQRLKTQWDTIWRFLETPFHRIDALYLHARTALAAAKVDTKNRASLLKIATRDSRILSGIGTKLSTAFASTVKAGLAAIEHPQKAFSLFEAAASLFDSLDMLLYAEVARYHGGKLRGGENGQELIAKAEMVMAHQGVIIPERFAALLIPCANR